MDQKSPKMVQNGSNMAPKSAQVGAMLGSKTVMDPPKSEARTMSKKCLQKIDLLSHLGGILAHCGTALGGGKTDVFPLVFQGLLENIIFIKSRVPRSSWGLLGNIMGPPGPSWSILGNVLGLSWDLLERSWGGLADLLTPEGEKARGV